jgi:hypothetical protein
MNGASPKPAPSLQFKTEQTNSVALSPKVEEDEVGGTCGTNGREEERV